MKILYIIPLLLLSGCFSAKVSHHSEVKSNVIDLRQKNTDAKIDENKDTQIFTSSIDTTVDIMGGSGSDTEQIAGKESPYLIVNGYADSFISHFDHLKKIKAVKNVQNAHSEAIYDPNTGKLILILVVRDTAIKVQGSYTKTTIADHITTNIDSSTKTKSNVKTDVSGSTSIGVSIMQMSWTGYVLGIIGLLIGIFIGKKLNKK